MGKYAVIKWYRYDETDQTMFPGLNRIIFFDHRGDVVSIFADSHESRKGLMASNRGKGADWFLFSSLKPFPVTEDGNALASRIAQLTKVLADRSRRLEAVERALSMRRPILEKTTDLSDFLVRLEESGDQRYPVRHSSSAELSIALAKWTTVVSFWAVAASAILTCDLVFSGDLFSASKIPEEDLLVIENEKNSATAKIKALGFALQEGKYLLG